MAQGSPGFVTRTQSHLSSNDPSVQDDLFYHSEEATEHQTHGGGPMIISSLCVFCRPSGDREDRRTNGGALTFLI